MTLLTSDLKLCNFITSWKLIKAPQNFVQGFSSIKLLKLCIITRISFWPQVPFNFCKLWKSYNTLLKHSFTAFVQAKKETSVEMVAVADGYLIVTDAQNKESKKQPFRIYLPVRLPDGKLLIERKKRFCI